MAMRFREKNIKKYEKATKGLLKTMKFRWKLYIPYIPFKNLESTRASHPTSEGRPH
jgi:hypothetical protein